MSLMRESIVVLALGLSLSSAAAPGETSFKVRRGQYPWHVWNSPVYKQNFTWPEFRKEVAKLNNLPDDNKSFRRLKRNTELKIPALPGAAPSASDIAKAKAEQRELDKAEFNALAGVLQSENQRLRDTLGKAAGSIYKNPVFWLWVVATGVVVGVAAYFFFPRQKLSKSGDFQEILRLRYENEKAEKRLAEAEEAANKYSSEFQELRRESDSRDHFIGKYTETYELPSDIGSFKGKHNRIYLLRRDELDGDPAVLAWNGKQYTAVKRKT